jgi:hypothetical protein
LVTQAQFVQKCLAPKSFKRQRLGPSGFAVDLVLPQRQRRFTRKGTDQNAAGRDPTAAVEHHRIPEDFTILLCDNPGGAAFAVVIFRVQGQNA